jgi:hypothetical protein
MSASTVGLTNDALGHRVDRRLRPAGPFMADRRVRIPEKLHFPPPPRLVSSVLPSPGNSTTARALAASPYGDSRSRVPCPGSIELIAHVALRFYQVIRTYKPSFGTTLCLYRGYTYKNKLASVWTVKDTRTNRT